MCHIFEVDLIKRRLNGYQVESQFDFVFVLGVKSDLGGGCNCIDELLPRLGRHSAPLLIAGSWLTR